MSQTIEQHVQAQADDWYRVGAEIGDLVRGWSNRNDLVVYAGPRNLPAPGMYLIGKGVIEIDTDQSFTGFDQAQVDLTDRIGRYDQAMGVGVCVHEALHARFTTYSFEYSSTLLNQREMYWMVQMEETRIESLGVKVLGDDADFLRATSLVLDVGHDVDVSKMTATFQAAQSALMTIARHDAGVLKKQDIKRSAKAIGKFIDKATLNKMRAIWVEFQNVKFISEETSGEKLRQLARDFDKLVQEKSKENNEPQQDPNAQKQQGQGQPQPGQGEPGDPGQGEPMPQEVKEALQELQEAMQGDATSTELEVAKDFGDKIREENRKQARADAAEKSKEKAQNQEQASKVFKLRKDWKPETGNDRQTDRSHQVRQPSGDEKSAVVTVARALRRAKYRDRLKSVRPAMVPPGKLRVRALVQGSALEAQGIRAPIEAFSQVQRTVVEDPNITVGMMTDFSGSMGGAMEPMAVSTYVMGEAVRRNQGKAAHVFFGRTVFSTLNPGAIQKEIHIQDAADSYEDFDTGFRSLDGALNLLNGRGARLLVIASDGEFKHDQIEPTRKWLRRCVAEGVAVLWLSYGGGGGVSKFTDNTHAEVVRPTGKPEEDALLIGSAAVQALAKASARR